MITVEELELLVGYSFDPEENARAGAVIDFVTTAAEGIVGTPVDLIVNDSLVKSVVVSAAMRMMQNKAGVVTATIGGFTAQYPGAGRIFTNEETMLLRRAQANSAGTVVIRNPYRYEAE